MLVYKTLLHVFRSLFNGFDHGKNHHYTSNLGYVLFFCSNHKVFGVLLDGKKQKHLAISDGRKSLDRHFVGGRDPKRFNGSGKGERTKDEDGFVVYLL